MAESGISPELQAILDSIGANTEASVSGMTSATSIGAEAALEMQQRQQEFLNKASEQAIGYYEPFIQAGNYWGGRAKDMIDAGAPKYAWEGKFDYAPWAWDKQFDYQKWDDYSKDRFTPEGIQKSPYYGLYQYQKDQQDQATNKMLRSRGLYNSGAGMKEALNKQSGIDESFMAGEYTRARGEYATDYEQALNDYTRDYNEQLQEHNIGYEEAKQKYGMSYDQYNKTFGVQQGQWQDQLNTMLGLREDQWRGSQGAANARIGQGNQLGQGAIQTGNTIAGLQSSLSSGIGSTYNAQGNQLTSLYNTNANITAQQALANQAQANYNAANQGNQILGYGTLAAGVGRNAWDAYRYYNSGSPTNPTSTLPTMTYPSGGYDYAYGDTAYTGDYVFGD